MANLETLELTISGTSGQAKQGIDSLTQSLSALSRALGKSINGLIRINSELAKLKSAGRIHLPTISATAGRSKAADEIARITAWQQSGRGITYSNGLGYQQGYMTDAERRAMNPQWYQDPIEQQKRAQEYLRDNGGQASWAKGNDQIAKSYDNIASSAKTATDSVNDASKAIKQSASTSVAASKQVSKLAKTYEQIGRIAKTMLIRTAIRYLMRAFSEAWNSAYEFSKQIGGQFAKNVELARGALHSTALSIIKTLAPALNALMPIIYTITNGINYLCNILQKLFQLMGIGSELFGVSAEEMDKYANSTKSGGKSTKNLLASWDQLNVIQSKSGGGGSSSGTGRSYFSDIVSDEMARMSIIVANSMLGIGLILACTGHPVIGTALMAVGAASLVKLAVGDFGKLSSSVKETIAQVMSIVGVSLFALGVILACTGFPTIGLGLMAIGVANIGLLMGVTYNSKGIVDNVQKTLMKIMVISALSLMAIGLIVAFVNPLLGIGLIAAGAAIWFSSMAYGGGVSGIVKTCQEILDDITGKFTGTLDNIKGAWDTVSGWFNTNVWQPMKEKAESAWKVVSQWWTENISPKLEPVWNGVVDFFDKLFGDQTQEGSITRISQDAWNSISDWWKTNVTSEVEKEGVWGGVKGFFKGLFVGENGEGGILGWGKQAFAEISKWWETNDISSKLSGAWDSVSSYFKYLIGDSERGILGDFNALWGEASQLWGDIKSKVQTAWGDIGNWFYNNVTMPVGNFFIDCINGIIDGINWLIGVLNSINITIPAVELPLIGQLWGETKIGISGIALVDKLAKLEAITQNANGAYGIPNGDLFIANEAGAELVGSIGGKTSVANQEQIIEGISNGVRSANRDQNDLLREQNRLLRSLLDKDWEVNPSAAWGKFNERSNDLWAMQSGR